MTQDQAGAVSPILPPRPNLGPEPWPVSDHSSPWWLLSAAPVVLLVIWWSRRRRQVAQASNEQVPRVNSPVVTASENLIHLVDDVREAMSRLLGSTWEAMTTEEIAIELPRIEEINQNLCDRTIVYLVAADRAKFAGGEISADRFAEAELWAADLLSALGKAGARSSQSGR